MSSFAAAARNPRPGSCWAGGRAAIAGSVVARGYGRRLDPGRRHLMIVLGANTNNDIVNVVLDAGGGWRGPFDGMFNLKNHKTGSRHNWVSRQSSTR